MKIGAVSSLLSGKGKWSSEPCDGVLRAMQHIFNETLMQARTLASKRLAKAIRAGHGPRVGIQSQAKGRVKQRKIHKIVQRNQEAEQRCHRLMQRQNVGNGQRRS